MRLSEMCLIIQRPTWKRHKCRQGDVCSEASVRKGNTSLDCGLLVYDSVPLKLVTKGREEHAASTFSIG